MLLLALFRCQRNSCVYLAHGTRWWGCHPNNETSRGAYGVLGRNSPIQIYSWRWWRS
jgi:hypothetical protein